MQRVYHVDRGYENNGHLKAIARENRHVDAVHDTRRQYEEERKNNREDAKTAQIPFGSGPEGPLRFPEDEKWRKIPIVLLASLLEPSDIIKIIESGADNFILKHYEESYFISRLRGIVDSMPYAKEDTPDGTRKVTLAGEDFEVALQPGKMLDMLVSAFETAVYQNWKAKEADDEE